MRIDTDAFVRKDSEGRNVFDKFHIRGAQSERKIGRQGRGDAEAAGHVNDIRDADLFGDLYSRNVAGPRQRASQSDGAFEFFVVVVRGIRLAAADDGERGVHDGVEG